MRILADEDCPRALVRILRESGHDVAWIRDEAPGASDAEVLSRAQRENRVVATFDKGFGDLAFRSGLPAGCGIVLFRLRGPTPYSLAARASEAFCMRTSWAGLFATVTDFQVRIRPLRRR